MASRRLNRIMDIAHQATVVSILAISAGLLGILGISAYNRFHAGRGQSAMLLPAPKKEENIQD